VQIVVMMPNPVRSLISVSSWGLMLTTTVRAQKYRLAFLTA